MPERNRKTLKMLLTLGLLAVAAATWRRGRPAPTVETEPTAVRAPMSEPATDPAPPPPRPRPRSAARLALVGAYTTLFFAGAAFTAIAGDQSVGLPEEDAAWTEESVPPAEPTTGPEAAPASDAPAEDPTPAPAADPFVE